MWNHAKVLRAALVPFSNSTFAARRRVNGQPLQRSVIVIPSATALLLSGRQLAEEAVGAGKADFAPVTGGPLEMKRRAKNLERMTRANLVLQIGVKQIVVSFPFCLEMLTGRHTGRDDEIAVKTKVDQHHRVANSQVLFYTQDWLTV